MTPDKRVEEIVKTFSNELAMHLTPSNEAMMAVRFAREALRDTLTQQHQDLMSEVVEKLEGMKEPISHNVKEISGKGNSSWQTKKYAIKAEGYNQALTEAQTIIKSLSK